MPLILPSDNETPYERGWRARMAGERAPSFPGGDATWAERLYFRGWSDAVRQIIANERKQQEGGAQ